MSRKAIYTYRKKKASAILEEIRRNPEPKTLKESRNSQTFFIVVNRDAV